MLRHETNVGRAEALRPQALGHDSENAVVMGFDVVGHLACRPQALSEDCAPALRAPEVADTTVVLRSLEEWAGFARENRDAILSDVGTLEHALLFALDGGFPLGGGAAPLFWIEVRIGEG